MNGMIVTAGCINTIGFSTQTHSDVGPIFTKKLTEGSVKEMDIRTGGILANGWPHYADFQFYAIWDTTVYIVPGHYFECHVMDLMRCYMGGIHVVDTNESLAKLIAHYREKKWILTCHEAEKKIEQDSSSKFFALRGMNAFYFARAARFYSVHYGPE